MSNCERKFKRRANFANPFYVHLARRGRRNEYQRRDNAMVEVAGMEDGEKAASLLENLLKTTRLAKIVPFLQGKINDLKAAAFKQPSGRRQ